MSRLSVWCILLLSLSPFLHSFTTVRRCSNLPKPITSSIQDCWEKTVSLAKKVAQKSTTTTGSCLSLESKKTLKELGSYLMNNFISLRCAVMMEAHLYTQDDIGTVNDLDLLIVEITGDPRICLNYNPMLDCFSTPLKGSLPTLSLQTKILENLNMRVITGITDMTF